MPYMVPQVVVPRLHFCKSSLRHLSRTPVLQSYLRVVWLFVFRRIFSTYPQPCAALVRPILPKSPLRNIFALHTTSDFNSHVIIGSVSQNKLCSICGAFKHYEDAAADSSRYARTHLCSVIAYWMPDVYSTWQHRLPAVLYYLARRWPHPERCTGGETSIKERPSPLGDGGRGQASITVAQCFRFLKTHSSRICSDPTTPVASTLHLFLRTFVTHTLRPSATPVEPSRSKCNISVQT